MGYAFKKGKNLQELEDVANLFKAATASSAVTLHYSQWVFLLNQMGESIKKEKERHSLVLMNFEPKDERNKGHTHTNTVPYLVILMRYFHDMYVKASEYVPLPLHLWNRWREGLMTCLWSLETAENKSRDDVELQQLKNEMKKVDATFSSSTSDGSSSEVGSSLLDQIKEDSSFSPNSEEVNLLLSVQKELIEEYQKVLHVNLWGSSCMVSGRLFPLLRKLESKAFPSDGQEEEEEIVKKVREEDGENKGQFSSQASCATRTAYRMDSLWFQELHDLSRLCKDSQHLFMVYPLIGQQERKILLQKFENLWVEEGAEGENEKEKEVAMESLLRRSFKRDFAVPSIALMNHELENEYENFEVDDKKALELKKMAARSGRSITCDALSTFYSHMESLQHALQDKEDLHMLVNHGEPAVKPTMPSSLSFCFRSPCILDEKGNQLADHLTQLWANASPEESYIAFAFTSQRIVDFESFPAVLNPSRLLFFLHLLHRWWKWYVKQTHRWTIHSLFIAEDDEDAIQFILERHEVILRHALITQEVTSNCTESSNEEAVKRKEASPLPKIEVLRIVTQSLIYCLGTYLSSLEEVPMSPAKRVVRREKALSQCHAWLKTYIVCTISVALMNDIYTYAEKRSEGSEEQINQELERKSKEENKESYMAEEMEVQSTDTDEEVEDAILILEGKLKVALLDAFVFFAPFFPAVEEENQVRICAVTTSILDQIEKRKGLKQVAPRVKKLWSVAFQLLQRSTLWLPTHPASSSSSLSASSTFVHQITWLLKRLLALASDVLREEMLVEAAADLWMVFSAQCIPHVRKVPSASSVSPTSSSAFLPGGITKEAFHILLPLPYDGHLRNASTRVSSTESSPDRSPTSTVLSRNVGNTTIDVLTERRKSLKRLRSEGPDGKKP